MSCAPTSDGIPVIGCCDSTPLGEYLWSVDLLNIIAPAEAAFEEGILAAKACLDAFTITAANPNGATFDEFFVTFPDCAQITSTIFPLPPSFVGFGQSLFFAAMKPQGAGVIGSLFYDRILVNLAAPVCWRESLTDPWLRATLPLELKPFAPLPWGPVETDGQWIGYRTRTQRQYFRLSGTGGITC